MSSQSVPDLVVQLGDLVRAMMLDVRPELLRAALTGDRGESRNTRHEDNFLSVHDLWMHERYRERLADLIDSFVYASEEADPQIIGNDPDPDLCVLVDPLDTSELAVRALNGYTHLMVYSRAQARPVVAVVGDIFHHLQLYVAFQDADGTDRAYAMTADGARHPLGPRPAKPLSQALVTNFLMRPGERFLPLSRQADLLAALDARGADGKRRGRIGLDFGSVGLCHVAAGLTDAVIEFAKGFAIWDLAPGHYILHAAGGCVLDLDSWPVSLDYQLDSPERIAQAMQPRQKFVAAGSLELAHEILRSLR
jgi:myo-inositol-1(or 4)-monophosphatase